MPASTAPMLAPHGLLDGGQRGSDAAGLVCRRTTAAGSTGARPSAERTHLIWLGLFSQAAISIAPSVCRQGAGFDDGHGGAGAGLRLLRWLRRPAAEPALAPGQCRAIRGGLALSPWVPVKQPQM